MTQCSERVYGDAFAGHRCTRKGVNHEDGRDWCKQHTPSLAKAKRDAAYAKMVRESNARIDARAAAGKRQERINSILTRLAAIETNCGDHASGPYLDLVPCIRTLVNDAKEVLK